MADDSGNDISRRKIAFSIFGLVVLLGVIGFFLWWIFEGSRHITTDNAYVDADAAQVAPQIGGAVKEVVVSDTQAVKAGDILVIIDDTDAQIALAQAEANYDATRRKVSQYFSSDDTYAAQITGKKAAYERTLADLTKAQSDFAKAEIDLKRRQNLAPDGAVSGEELTNAQAAYNSAKSALAVVKANSDAALADMAAAKASQKTNHDLVAGTTLDDSPEVKAAAAALNLARQNLARTIIRSPIDGVIAKKTVEVGQRVMVGAPLMDIVSLSNAYVDANFKEVQTGKIRVGQKVKLFADTYGKSVVYNGTVIGRSAGTGSAFAIIPSQNATGNWIKVVQRLPIKIALDPKELQAHPLQVGLSMNVDVDERN